MNAPIPLTGLQVEAISIVAKGHVSNALPGVSEASDRFFNLFIQLVPLMSNELEAAAAKAKQAGESWWQYWDRVMANDRLPGETHGAFLDRMKKPKTVDRSKIVYPPRFQWTPVTQFKEVYDVHTNTYSVVPKTAGDP